MPPYRPEQHDLLADLLGVSSGSLSGMFSISLIKAIVAQRSYKSAVEIEEINRAVNTTAAMQLAAITLAKAGMTEAQIAGKMQEIAIGAGGNLSFPTILTQQGQILHNGYSHSLLTAGNLVLSDCGAETGMHYAGDLTRTFPVSNTFTTIQRDIYDIVLRAHGSAVALLQPGKPFRDVHLHACEKLTEGLQQLGIMKGDAKEAVALGAHALFFPCGLGHMMGLDTHDMENLGEQYVGYNDEIKKDISLLMVKDNTYVEAGSEIIKDIRTENAGYLRVIEENGIVEKIIIKVGKIIKTAEEVQSSSEIIETGEKICKGIYAESPCLLESVPEGILIRTADEYYINREQFQIETEHSLNGNQSIGINLTQHLSFKEGEKIESINGIDLVKTYLTVDISSDQIHGSADIEFLDTNSKGRYKLQVAIIENLQIKQDTFIEDSKQQIKTHFCVKDGQEIIPGQLVAQTSLISKSKGKIKRGNSREEDQDESG